MICFYSGRIPQGTVEQYIQRSSLEDCCLVAGEVSYDDLPSWLSVAQLAVDPKGKIRARQAARYYIIWQAGYPWFVLILSIIINILMKMHFLPHLSQQVTWPI